MSTPYQLVIRFKQSPLRLRTSAFTKWERRHPEIAEVYVLVSQAIRFGWLKRRPCETCGAKAEAHHDDYKKPLAVRWLCRTHHRRHHAETTRELAS